jgi:hypothetical protein
MTPLEAAARASWDATKGYGTVDWDALAALPDDTIGHRTAERHRAIVRAAIEAIREASDQMIDAIHSTHRPGWDVSWRYVWKTMLDALLAEHSETST